jgi:hypothetical protein
VVLAAKIKAWGKTSKCSATCIAGPPASYVPGPNGTETTIGERSVKIIAVVYPLAFKRTISPIFARPKRQPFLETANLSSPLPETPKPDNPETT